METRRKLMDAGERLISASGSNTVSVDDIVKECGVARGTFYIYFRNMADLVEAITRQPYKDVGAEIEAMEEAGATLGERLERYLQEFMVTTVRYGPKIAQQWVRTVIDPDSIPEGKDRGKLQFDLEAMREVLRRAVARGELSEDAPVDDIADMATVQLYGLLTCWCMTGGRMDTSEAASDYCRMQLIPSLRPYMEGERCPRRTPGSSSQSSWSGPSRS